jgi:alpha-amylase
VLAKEAGLERHLTYDWYRRASYQDHFLGPGATLEAVARCHYPELGDFVNQPYAPRVQKRGDEVLITLERKGALWEGDHRHRVTVCKVFRYVAGARQFTVEYTITNNEPEPKEIHFAVECNTGLMAGDAHDRYYRIPGRELRDRTLRSSGEELSVDEVELADEYLGVRTGWRLSRPATLWRYPIETVSLSEQGFERLYQSSTTLFRWKTTLKDQFALRLVQFVGRT